MLRAILSNEEARYIARRLPVWLLSAVCLAVFYVAVDRAGWLVGWLIGASQSPIMSAIAPSLLALVTAAAIRDRARGKWASMVMLSRALVVAVGVAIFCPACYSGITHGIRSRTEPYRSIDELLGLGWHLRAQESVENMYAFRWESQRAGLPFREYESLMSDVIKPIVDRPDLSQSAKGLKLFETFEGLAQVLRRPPARPIEASKEAK